MVKSFCFNQMENASLVHLILKCENKETRIPMQKTEQGFKADIELVKGIYQYKFLVNNIMRFNDPQALEYAKDNRGEVWSILNLSADSEDSVDKRHELMLEDYALSNCETVGKLRGQRTFSYPKDKIVCMSVDMSVGAGLHSITVIWYRGDGRIYCGQEISIEKARTQITTRQNFKIRLDNKRIRWGIWKVELYFDGKKVISDYFSLNNKSTINRCAINIQL